MLDPKATYEAPLAGRFTRRRFLEYSGAVGALAAMDRFVPSYVPGSHGVLRSGSPGVLSGSGGPVEITIAETAIEIAGRRGTAVTMNGTVPAPLLRFREGDDAVIHVTNRLEEDTSIHWHGILLPNGMDGVPGVTFDAIPPGETFTYRFPIRQYGTYWYHSHSGLQEQLGHYGPLVIDPADGEPTPYDREYVIVLSDWTFENPYRVLARLKKRSDSFNFQKRTVGDFFRDASEDGLGSAVRDRLAWGRMRMNPTDVSDVTGATYTYLVNGLAPGANWTGLFEPGERVRLRFVNTSAASIFDVRIPGLPLTVIQVSGQHVRPVETDEIRIGVAERYDVIVEVTEERAYTIFAEAADRSGYARGTLAPRGGMEAAVPEPRGRPLLTMADMGMMDMAEDRMGEMMQEGMRGLAGMHDRPDSVASMAAREGHQMPMGGETSAVRPPGTVPEPSMHSPDHHGPGNAGVAMSAQSRLHEPGLGLGHDGWRVLSYSDLEALRPNPDFRLPDREIEMHLTGNMERFMWSMDGVKFSDAEPIRVPLGERIRLTMVNDTMMNHPMHLHGMFMELENGAGASIPWVDTVLVKPAEKLSVLFTADVPGPWAFHCHILYHMDAGMFRVFDVVEQEEPR